MKRLFALLMLVMANTAMMWAACSICDSWVDDDEYCSDCHMCLDCAVDQAMHCASCKECYGDDDEGLCSDCSYCRDCRGEEFCIECNTCSDCGNEICDECWLCEACYNNTPYHCASCYRHDDEGVCEACYLCHECAEGHCVNCNNCPSLLEICGDCGMCNDCVIESHAHCESCGDCFGEDGVCPDCNLCESCSESNGIHCFICGDCMLDNGYCKFCGSGFGDCNHCDDCGLLCELCGKCFLFAEEDWCYDCGLCLECGAKIEMHCNECLEHVGDDFCPSCGMGSCCRPDDMHCCECGVCFESANKCEYCGDQGSDTHCEDCGRPYMCESCYCCYFMGDEDMFIPELGICYDCAAGDVGMGVLCLGCESTRMECENCGYCLECMYDLHVHCINCDACLMEENGACEDCGLCEDCTEALLTHCESCGRCQGGEGEICESCRFCDECAMDEGRHCPECELCFDEGELCDNCGMCEDCALSQGVHCEVCEECKPDEQCESGGLHCTDCCEENGWLCEQCGQCTEALGLSFCDVCELCYECCAKATKEAGCDHDICVASTDWEDHYCFDCNMCLSDCKHNAKYEEHVCSFVNGVCSVCKSREDGFPTIFRQPRSVVVPVNNYEALKDGDESVILDTVSFTVMALGDGLKYQWFRLDGTKRVELMDGIQKSNIMTTGTQKAKFVTTVPPQCSSVTSYICVVSNAVGAVVSDTVTIKTTHNMKLTSGNLLGDDLSAKSTVTLKRASETATEDSVVVYSDCHYLACVGTGCENTYGNKKAPHTYGDWTVSCDPTSSLYGCRYRSCTVCGEKKWENMLPVDGKLPVILTQPRDTKVKSPDFHSSTWIEDTASYSVRVKTSNEPVSYQWYDIKKNVKTGSWTTAKKLVDAPKDVWGATSNRMTRVGNDEGCNGTYEYYVYCLVSNKYGTVSTDTVREEYLHNLQWMSSYYTSYPVEKGEWKNFTILNSDGKGTPRVVQYSDNHYKLCVNCEKMYEGKKEPHHYGEWIVEVKPSAGRTGCAYRLCDDCMERQWINTANDGITHLTTTGPTLPVKTPDIDSLFSGSDCKGTDGIYDTISFSVDVVEKECTFQWYFEYYDAAKSGYVRADYLGDDDPEAYLKGVKTRRVTLTVPPYCEAMYTVKDPRMCCEITNAAGNLTTSVYRTFKLLHNMNWAPITFASFLSSEEESKYMQEVIIDNYREVGTKRTISYSDYHFWVCKCDGCRHYEGKKQKHTYGPWKLSVAPSSKNKGSRYRSCTVCGASMWENIPMMIDSKNPYLDEYQGDFLFEVVSSKFGNRSFYMGEVRNGKDEYGDPYYEPLYKDKDYYDTEVTLIYGNEGFIRDLASQETSPTLFVVTPDGKVRPMENSSDGYYAGRLNLYDDKRGDVPAGSYITSNPNKFRQSSRFSGEYTRILSTILRLGKEYLFEIAGEKYTGSFVEIDSPITPHDVTVLLDDDVMLYNGQRIEVYNGTSHIGFVTVGDCAVPKPMNYIVSSSGEKVMLDERSSGSYFNSTVDFNPESAILRLKNGASLRSIHWESVEFNGNSKLTILVDEGSHTISNTSSPAIDVAGDLNLMGELGATLNVSSTTDAAIKVAGGLYNLENEVFQLNVRGRGVAISAANVEIDMAEVYIRCDKNPYAVPVLCTNPSEYSSFSGAVYEEGIHFGEFDKYNYDLGEYEHIYGFYRNEEEDDEIIIEDLHIYTDPNISVNGRKIHDAELRNIKDPHMYRGTLSYDFLQHTLFVDGVQLSGWESANLVKIGTSNLDTLYVNVKGENLFDHTTPESISDYSQSGVFYVEKDLCLVGDGFLKVVEFSSKSSAIVLRRLMKVDDKVALGVYSNELPGITSKNGECRLFVGKKASMFVDNGFGPMSGITFDGDDDVDSDTELIRAKRIVYPSVFNYKFDRSTGLLSMNCYPEPKDKKVVVAPNLGVRLGNTWIYDFGNDEDENNFYDPLNDGTVSFDPASRTLTLSGASLERYKSNAALYAEKNIKVVVEDNVTVSGSSDDTDKAAAFEIAANASVTLLGDTIDFTMTGDDYPALLIGDNATLSMNGLSAARFGENAVVAGPSYISYKESGKEVASTTSKLLVANSELSFDKDASLYSLDLNLKGVAFSDTLMSFDNAGTLGAMPKVISGSGAAAEKVTGNFEIIEKKNLPSPGEITALPESVSEDLEELDVDQPMYNVLGVQVDRNFRGVVVQKGRRYILWGDRFLTK